jgi:cell division protein FtsA
MSKEQYITGLDIGTSAVRAVQGRINPEDGVLNVIGASESESFGIRKGVLVDIEEAVSGISSVLEKVERMTGVPIESAYVSVSGSHISTLQSHGVIAVSRADGEISEADVVRCVDASQAISVPQNREILHVFPKSFTLDGQTGIRDPLGMSGVRLEVDTLIVQAGLPFIRNLSRTITQAGLEINDLVLAPLATAECVLTKRQKDLGVAVVDLGGGTTSLAVYEEGDLLHASVLPLGQQHLTNDLAIGLRSSIETAEKVKLLYGHTDPKAVNKLDEIDLAKIDEQEKESVERGYVAEIMEARLEEIFAMVAKELKNIGRDGKLPSGIVLTGGGAKLPGVVDFAKKQLRLPCVLGKPQNITTVIDRIDDPSFATVVGLLLWGQKYGQVGSFTSSNMLSSVKSAFSRPGAEKVKKWLKSFLP